MIIAIHPDTLGSADDSDCSHRRWRKLLEAAGHEVRYVNAFKPDILEQVRGCDGFMWRFAHVSRDKAVARRLLRILEDEMHLAVYPNQPTCWHFDDKVAQTYLFSVHGIPQPKTHVFWCKDAALGFARSAHYPIVLKLPGGAGSSNVRLLKKRREAEYWVKKVFGRGVSGLDMVGITGLKRHAIGRAKDFLRGRQPVEHWYDLYKNKILFQEFLPDNPFDTRITVIGNRAFGFRRMNRPKDFRASGSGVFDANPGKIDLDTVRLAYSTARKLRTASMAIDGLRRGDDRVVVEVSYCYVSWPVAECPGHWELAGEPEDGELVWVDGSMYPEEAQIQDFLKVLDARAAHSSSSTPHQSQS